MTKDANIVVTFSEPMNQVATQAAYQSADLPSGSVTFSWNGSGTQLTINPNADLIYLKTANPNAAPKTYSFSLTNTATSVAGNKLANTPSSFSTLKDVTSNFQRDALTGDLRSSGWAIHGAAVYVGDEENNVTYRGFISFDISSLPSALTGTRILAATLTYYISFQGTPFDDLLTCTGGGAGVCTHLIIDSVNYGPTLDASDFDVAVLREVRAYRRGVVQEPRLGSNAVDVLTAIQDDVDNRASRGDRSQFRFRFSRLTDTDGAADIMFVDNQLAYNSPVLEIQYLIP